MSSVSDLAPIDLNLDRSSGGEDFARVLGHDLKAPVASMAALAAVLAEDARERLSEDDREIVNQIVRSGERATAMIAALLELSRATSGLIEVETFSAYDEVHSLLQTELAVMVAETGAEITCESLSFVRYDRALFRIVMLNLLSNAMKFCAPGEAPKVVVRCRGTSHGMVTIAVRDYGIGIPRKQQRRIFDMSVRLDNVGRYDGSGLGLSTVRRVIERCGGALEVRSEVGRGSEFRVTIPGGVPRAEG